MSVDRPRLNFAALAAVLLWSGTYVAGKVALADFTAVGLIGIRYLTAAVLLSLLLPAGDRRALVRPGPERWPLVLAGLLHVANQLAWAVGLQYTTASHSVLLFATSPIWTALVAAAFGVDRLRRHVGAGVAIALLGVALIVWPSLEVGGVGLLGDGLTLLSPVCFAGSTVLVVGAARRHGPFACTTSIIVVGAIAGLPLTALALAGVDWGAARPEAWVALAYSVFGAFVLAQMLWFRSVSQIGSTQAAVYNYLQPVLGLALAAVLLGERLGPLQFAGAAVVLTGIALAQGRLGGLPARIAVRPR